MARRKISLFQRIPMKLKAGIYGTVTVKILVDERGNVISAKALSGPPLLRQAAEEAALRAKFSPTRLAGQPVKVSGTITFNFTLK
jgi:protein TonB